MMTNPKTFLRGCAALAALSLAACANPVNGPEDGMTVEQRFPITVEPHMEMVRLTFNAARGGLDQESAADLERFARDYLDNGSGALAVSGSRRNPDAPRIVADRLLALGVPGDRILLGNPDNADSGDDIRVSFIRYEAHAQACGDWSVNLSSTSANKVSPNFGCATQHNLAAMVADPGFAQNEWKTEKRPHRGSHGLWVEWIARSLRQKYSLSPERLGRSEESSHVAGILHLMDPQ